MGYRPIRSQPYYTVGKLVMVVVIVASAITSNLLSHRKSARIALAGIALILVLLAVDMLLGQRRWRRWYAYYKVNPRERVALMRDPNFLSWLRGGEENAGFQREYGYFYDAGTLIKAVPQTVRLERAAVYSANTSRFWKRAT